MKLKYFSGIIELIVYHLWWWNHGKNKQKKELWGISH